jgi:hypothetical protein
VVTCVSARNSEQYDKSAPVKNMVVLPQPDGVANLYLVFAWLKLVDFV